MFGFVGMKKGRLFTDLPISHMSADAVCPQSWRPRHAKILPKHGSVLTESTYLQTEGAEDPPQTQQKVEEVISGMGRGAWLISSQRYVHPVLWCHGTTPPHDELHSGGAKRGDSSRRGDLRSWKCDCKSAESSGLQAVWTKPEVLFVFKSSFLTLMASWQRSRRRLPKERT